MALLFICQCCDIVELFQQDIEHQKYVSLLSLLDDDVRFSSGASTNNSAGSATSSTSSGAHKQDTKSKVKHMLQLQLQSDQEWRQRNREPEGCFTGCQIRVYYEILMQHYEPLLQGAALGWEELQMEFHGNDISGKWMVSAKSHESNGESTVTNHTSRSPPWQLFDRTSAPFKRLSELRRVPHTSTMMQLAGCASSPGIPYCRETYRVPQSIRVEAAAIWCLVGGYRYGVVRGSTVVNSITSSVMMPAPVFASASATVLSTGPTPHAHRADNCRRSCRTRLTLSHDSVDRLIAEYSQNPEYNSRDNIERLVEELSILDEAVTVQRIKTWFANTRANPKRLERRSHHMLCDPSAAVATCLAANSPSIAQPSPDGQCIGLQESINEPLPAAHSSASSSSSRFTLMNRPNPLQLSRAASSSSSSEELDDELTPPDLPSASERTRTQPTAAAVVNGVRAAQVIQDDLSTNTLRTRADIEKLCDHVTNNYWHELLPIIQNITTTKRLLSCIIRVVNDESLIRQVIQKLVSELRQRPQLVSQLNDHPSDVEVFVQSITKNVLQFTTKQ